jgi:hypothetical protein
VTDETIQKDVSAEDQVVDQQPEQEASEPEFDPRGPRERKMAEVAEKRRAQMEADRKTMALVNDPDLTEEQYDAKQVADESGEAAVAAAGGVTAESEDGPALKAEPEEQRPERRGFEDRGDGTLVKKLKVNGRVVELTEDEYDRQLAKDLAGDQKLRMAAEQERALREREERIARTEQQMKTQEPPAPGAAEVDIEQALSEYHDAVYAGDTDEAKAKLKAVLAQARPSSTPNMDELVTTISTRVKEEAEAERYREYVDKGWDQFKKDYADVATDPKKLAYADAVLKEVYAEHPDWTPDKVILEAGRMTAEDFKPTPTTDSHRDEVRLDRKANLKPVPSSGSARKQSDRAPQVDMSPAAKIARMRTNRAL